MHPGEKNKTKKHLHASPFSIHDKFGSFEIQNGTIIGFFCSTSHPDTS